MRFLSDIYMNICVYMNIARGTATVVEVRLGHGFTELNVSFRCVYSSLVFILIADSF